VNIHELVSDLIVNTKGTADGGFLAITRDSSLGAFLPELVICLTIVLLLTVRLFDRFKNFNVFWVALAGSIAGFVLAEPLRLFQGEPILRMEIFTGMLVYDSFTIYMRLVLLGFAVLFLIFTKLSGIPDREDAADIYSLVMGATLGMCLMASANHLLMVFMAIEMASVPSYVLAGMLKGRRQGSEAALKYAVFGAGASGVMLYGISLIAGLVGTVHLPTLAVLLAEMPLDAGSLMVLGLAGLMIAVGLAFKLSAVPFHFWCPDVFEGACAEVNAFLSIASKAAALALLVRIAIGFGTIQPAGVEPGSVDTQQQAVAMASSGLFAVSDEPISAQEAPAAVAESANLQDIRSFIGKLIALLAVITCTFGNLAAYGQTNIKRMLAYSTIAHAGYMMMALPPIMALVAVNVEGANAAVAALAIYIFTYVFMNLGAFAIVAFLRNKMGSEEIADYAGLVKQCPGIVICLALMLFSLVGLPPLAGFIGKFAIFASLADGYTATSQNYLLYLLVIGGLNTVISLFYYLRVIKTTILDDPVEGRESVSLPLRSGQGVYIIVLTIPTAVLIVYWNPLYDFAKAAADSLF
jgi:NADH-quinone oxidoreductase subunit N